MINLKDFSNTIKRLIFNLQSSISSLKHAKLFRGFMFYHEKSKSHEDKEKSTYYHISGDRSIYTKSTQIACCKDATVHNCFS